MDFFRMAGCAPPYLIWQFLIISDVEPWLAAVGCSCLKYSVNLLDKRLGEIIFRPVNYKIDATEMVGSLYDIIDIDTFISNADCICLENKTSLLVCQATPFYMVGVVSEVYLGTVIYSATNLTLFLFSESFQ